MRVASHVDIVTSGYIAANKDTFTMLHYLQCYLQWVSKSFIQHSIFRGRLVKIETDHFRT